MDHSMTEHNIVSVSGGKDSTALLLLAIERGAVNLQAVFADTGHEHPQTYEYVRYLEKATGVPIRWVRADFSQQIARKAQYVREKWIGKLMRDLPGKWIYQGDYSEVPDGLDPTTPNMPINPFGEVESTSDWKWLPAVRGMSQADAQATVDRALAILDQGPTGNPFLDLCIWKGRFPSTKARFCSEELKRNPIIEQVQMPLMEQGAKIISWQGVRADESPSRALLPELDCNGSDPESGGELWNYRPILQWKVEEVFAMHRKHGIEPNPLYSQGMGRVGCMPCIHARKDELLEISKRFPEEIERVAEWERIVSQASKRGGATFFVATDLGVTFNDERALEGGNILKFVEWSKTSKGRKNYDLFRSDNDGAGLCSSIYGLCE